MTARFGSIPSRWFAFANRWEGARFWLRVLELVGDASAPDHRVQAAVEQVQREPLP